MMLLLLFLKTTDFRKQVAYVQLKIYKFFVGLCKGRVILTILQKKT